MTKRDDKTRILELEKELKDAKGRWGLCQKQKEKYQAKVECSQNLTNHILNVCASQPREGFAMIAKAIKESGL